MLTDLSSCILRKLGMVARFAGMYPPNTLPSLRTVSAKFEIGVLATPPDPQTHTRRLLRPQPCLPCSAEEGPVRAPSAAAAASSWRARGASLTTVTHVCCITARRAL